MSLADLFNPPKVKPKATRVVRLSGMETSLAGEVKKKTGPKKKSEGA